MKVMDVKMDTSEDCTGSIPKPKKLKQARLPFQMLSSPLVPNTVSAKKRKLSSPSPTNYKSPKVSKLEKKENSLKEPEIIDVDLSPVKNDDTDLSIVASGSPDTIASKDKKLDPKNSMKPGALTTLFQKIASAPPKPPPPSQDAKTHENNVAIVLLSRCDDKSEIKPVESTSTSAISTHNSEESARNDDSSNESLAEVLPNSEDDDDDDDDDDNSKGKSTDNNLDNSESDTEISSSEDEKKSNDDTEEVVKNLSDNLLKTPEPNKNKDKSQVKKHQLTPKQLEKRLESAKKREEREKLKAERQIQRNEEKIKRRKELEDKKKARKEKEEAEKELKRKEKEQKEMKKQMEIEQKQKEKERKEKAKEEDKRKREEAKEEEKRKKEEEKLEAERKKQKAASTFVSFFVPKKLDNKTVDDEKIIEVSNFMPFEIKADMKIAPVYRRLLTDEEKIAFDDYFRNSNKNEELYLQVIKQDKSRIKRSGKTWPNEAKDDVVIIEEEEDDNNSDVVNQPAGKIENQRAKLLAFKENRRPPYWGTWRKKSTTITPRRPFAKDTKWFDYEVDSDEEWEEEEPGESLRGSDDEKDEENPDDNEYDVDNEFMVPHGYLSDEEAQADEEDDEEMAPEMQKDKLKILEEEFEAEMKTKTSKIKPKVIGCIWQGFLNSYPDNVPVHIVNFLMLRQAWVRETPIPLIPPAESDNQVNSESLNRKKLPEEAIPDLIRLVHGNLHGRPFLVQEFVTYWNKNHSRDDTSFTKVSVSRKIKEISKRIACPDEGPMQSKICWYVPEETRKKYSLEDLRLPNQWTYLLTPKRKTLTEGVEVTEKNEKDGKEKLKDSDKDQKKTVPLITMFTKKITQEEMQKQLLVKPTSISKPSTSLNRPPKRATLISVPRGEHFPQNSILTAFSKANDAKKGQEVVGTCDKPITLSDDDDDAPAKREENSESTKIDGDILELKKDTEIQQITEKLDNENEMEKTK